MVKKGQDVSKFESLKADQLAASLSLKLNLKLKNQPSLP